MFLGIDVGTSCVKAVLLDGDGRIAGEARGDLTVSRPRALWSEQAPQDWWQATHAAVSGLDLELRRKVRGVGLAGQMHGAVALDKAHQPLRPAILWNDGRAELQCAALERVCPDSRAITGNPAMAGFTAPKLLWMAEHEPELFDRIDKVLLPKDYVRLRMTGDLASDMSDASGTLWLDVAGRAWSDAMLTATGLTRDHMPKVVEGTDQTGCLRQELAEAWGMARVPVAAGGGDNAAGAIGVGVVQAGDAFVSLGTSGVLFVVTDRFRPNPDAAVHAFAHALPGQWHQMAVMLSAASCLEWGRQLLGLPSVDAFIACAEVSGDGAGVIFLPYLTGERTPHGDPHAKGVLFGLSAGIEPGHIAYAILEGVALGLRDGLDALLAAGSSLGMITVAGGGARSPFWGRLIAAALDRPLAYRTGSDVGPALGAARLAAIAIGAGSVADICQAPPITGLIEPDPLLREAMEDRLGQYRDIYTQLKANFRSPT